MYICSVLIIEDLKDIFNFIYIRFNKFIIIYINIFIYSIQETMNTKKVLKFITGNKKKLEEAKAIFERDYPDIELVMEKADIPELQGDPVEIVQNKLQWAIERVEGPLLVEDTSLCFNAFGGLPGPYIKDFLTKLGTKGLYKLLEGFEDKTAYSQCIFGLITKKGEKGQLFVGQTKGRIVDPRGPDNFGWDPVFEPNGFDKTYAEIPSEEKNKISHRSKSLALLLEHLKTNPL